MNTSFFLLLTAANFFGQVEEFSEPVDPKRGTLPVMLPVGPALDSLHTRQSASQLLMLVLLLFILCTSCFKSANKPGLYFAATSKHHCHHFPWTKQGPLWDQLVTSVALPSPSPLKTSENVPTTSCDLIFL